MAVEMPASIPIATTNRAGPGDRARAFQTGCLLLCHGSAPSCFPHVVSNSCAAARVTGSTAAPHVPADDP